MSRKSVLEPEEFSNLFTAFLAQLVEREGWDSSGRELAKRAPARAKTFWHERISGEKILNTADIAVLAGIFNVSPFLLTAAVLSGDIDAIPVVGGDSDTEPTPLSDEMESELRASSMRLAAKRGKRK